MQKPLALGQECIPENEAEYIDKIIVSMRELLEKSYPTGPMKRAFHPKIHGLVKANFIVEPNLPEELKVGLFAEEQTYQAWVRFSNAKRKPQKDIKKDIRGMAIKLVDVPGEKVLEDEKDATTHDFLLITHETLQTDTVESFQEGIEALLGGFPKMIGYAINPANWDILVRSIQSLKRFSNILDAQFWSTTAYRFGAPDKAVKYSVRPQIHRGTPYPECPSDDFLREQLVKDLSEGDACFDFLIQIQADPVTMPIEDPTVPWDAPYVKVATLHIPQQVFDSKEQRSYGQSLSFTPWHCLPEHHPIGGANRARKKVYEKLAAFRLARTGQNPQEPSDLIVRTLN